MPKLRHLWLALCLMPMTAFAEDTLSSLPALPPSDANSSSIDTSLPESPTSIDAMIGETKSLTDDQRSGPNATFDTTEPALSIVEENRPELEMYPERAQDMKGVHGYRDFFYPTYNAMRVAYCNPDRSTCGKPIADKYCNIMGYKRASAIRVDHNVGLTKYVGTQLQCKGWRCDGFKWITCIESLEKTPKPVYYYRYRAFEAPRFENYRIAWCYEHDRKGCGKRAANAFCRHMGYMRAKRYDKDTKIAATRNIGDGTLCFGDKCQGFSHITCHR